jgi:hypothetical protein
MSTPIKKLDLSIRLGCIFYTCNIEIKQLIFWVDAAEQAWLDDGASNPCFIW